MKKIMFNDRYGLTEAVLQGRKTQTRRIIKWDMLCDMREDSIRHISPTNILSDNRYVFTAFDAADNPIGQAISTYGIGEEVAIAQNYQAAGVPASFDCIGPFQPNAEFHAGWNNKMFVRADLMPHRIRINHLWCERLANICDEDCLREGIYKYNPLPDALGEDRYKFISYAYDATQDKHRRRKWLPTPREAFAALIDKVSRKGTWNLNPWVFVYEFELIK